ncbi:MAG: DUF1257 domain-containing protein [Lentisphaerae bacterium]|jgi:hypothetical protein|nr:DUF1257 domain-containing protein [Lentisphaerota bacterium]
MSHFTTIETQIRDIAALKAACAELGVGLEAGAEARGYGRRQVRGDYVVRLKGPYDIAADRMPDGGYRLTTDWWSGHVEKEVGKNYGRLLQLYGVHKAQIEARRKGLSTQRRTLADGSVKLVIGVIGGVA